MDVLTEDQAGRLRALRPRFRPVIADSVELASAFLNLCDHEATHPECPACQIEKAFAGVPRLLEDAAALVDAHLTRGPHPQARK